MGFSDSGSRLGCLGVTSSSDLVGLGVIGDGSLVRVPPFSPFLLPSPAASFFFSFLQSDESPFAIIVWQCCIQLSSNGEIINGDTCNMDPLTLENMLYIRGALDKSTLVGPITKGLFCSIVRILVID